MTRTPQDMIRSSNVAAVVTNPNLPDNPIIDCNEAFLELTGYAREQVLGRNCRFLSGPDTEPAKKAELRAAISERRPTMVEFLNYRKNGDKFRNALIIAPIFDGNGQLLAFLGTQSDLSSGDQMPIGKRRTHSYELFQALTSRQREVATMMAAGKMIKQIVHELGVCERTIKMHRAGALKAMGVDTSAEIIRTVVEAGY